MISKISATQMSCTDDYENNILKAIQLIKKAKEEVKNTVKAYLMKDDDGKYI